jgi:hypothetical protein
MATTWYQVTMPVVPASVGAFSFSCSVANTGWSFVFLFINNHWTCYATPTGMATREAAVFSSVINWKGFPDFWCYFTSTIPEPGLNDIGTVSMYIVDRRT